MKEENGPRAGVMRIVLTTQVGVAKTPVFSCLRAPGPKLPHPIAQSWLWEPHLVVMTLQGENLRVNKAVI